MAFTPNITFVAGTRLGAGSLNSTTNYIGSELNGTLNTGVRQRLMVWKTVVGSIWNSQTETIIGSVFVSGNSANDNLVVNSMFAQVTDGQGIYTTTFRVRAGSVGTTADPTYFMGSIICSGTTRLTTHFVPLMAVVTGLSWAGSNFVSVTAEHAQTDTALGAMCSSVVVWGA